MTKHLLPVVAAFGLMSSAAFAQMYITMSPPPTVPPYFGERGSTTITPSTSPTADKTKTMTGTEGGTITTRVKAAAKQE
jgi:hypothetical protein